MLHNGKRKDRDEKQVTFENDQKIRESNGHYNPDSLSANSNSCQLATPTLLQYKHSQKSLNFVRKWSVPEEMIGHNKNSTASLAFCLS